MQILEFVSTYVA